MSLLGATHDDGNALEGSEALAFVCTRTSANVCLPRSRASRSFVTVSVLVLARLISRRPVLREVVHARSFSIRVAWFMVFCCPARFGDCRWLPGSATSRSIRCHSAYDGCRTESERKNARMDSP